MPNASSLYLRESFVEFLNPTTDERLVNYRFSFRQLRAIAIIPFRVVQ